MTVKYGTFEIGLLIHEQRLEKNMRLRDLAAKTGVSASAINKIEKGRNIPGAEVLSKLLTALGGALIIELN